MDTAAGWFWAHDIRPDQVGAVVTPGARLVRLAGYGSGPRRRLAALVQLGAAGARRSWAVDLDAAALAALPAGVRAVAVTAWDDGGDGPRYAVVLEDAPAVGVHGELEVEPAQAEPTAGVRVGLDEAGLALLCGSRQVADLATYRVGGLRAFAAAVGAGSGGSRLFAGVRPAELGARLRAAGLVPRLVRAYRDPGQPLLLACLAEPVAAVPGGRAWYADLDADAVARRLERNGARPLDLDAIRDGDGVRFTVVMG